MRAATQNVEGAQASVLHAVNNDRQLKDVVSVIKKPVLDIALPIENLSPRKATEHLRGILTTEAQRVEWAQAARIEAILGSCPGSVESAKSGMRAWLAFFRCALRKSGNAFPPTATDLAASHVFSSIIIFLQLSWLREVGLRTHRRKHRCIS